MINNEFIFNRKVEVINRSGYKFVNSSYEAEEVFVLDRRHLVTKNRVLDLKVLREQ